jgi:hypothetical protein
MKGSLIDPEDPYFNIDSHISVIREEYGEQIRVIPLASEIDPPHLRSTFMSLVFPGSS